MVASVRDPVPTGLSKKRRNELAHVTEKFKKLQVWLDLDVHPVSLETFSVCPTQGGLHFMHGLQGLAVSGSLFPPWAISGHT